MKIQMIVTELITICPLSTHIKILPNYLNLGVVPPCKEGGPNENDASNLSRTCLWLPLPEWVKLFPVMFHINETYLNLPFYWYQYWYVCALDKKWRWRYNHFIALCNAHFHRFKYALPGKVNIASPCPEVCTKQEKKKEIWPSPMTKPPIQQKIRKPKDNTQTPPKTSITQRLRTDLGRSVGVTSHPTGVVKCQ